MARLIDAERFECIGFQATGEQRYDDGFADGVMFISERIDSAPTVDAVPVEWIIDRANDPERAPLYRRYAQMLYEEWQKEQEAR